MSEIQTSVDFRHLKTVQFPNSSDFRPFCEMSKIRNQSLVFRHIGVSEIQNPKSQKFRFQTHSVYSTYKYEVNLQIPNWFGIRTGELGSILKRKFLPKSELAKNVLCIQFFFENGLA